MAIKLSGMISGMDTEGMVKELMKAQSLKKTKIDNKITMTQWKMDKWKDLNAKIYSFYTGSLSKLKLQGSFNTKKISSTDDVKVSVTADTSAPQGTQLLKIKQLASGQYVTSGALSSGTTTGTKLSTLGFDTSIGTTITINGADGKSSSLDVGSSTTVQDFIDACKSAGLYANFDTNQKRLFISSKESGLENAFSITTSVSEEARDRNSIRDFLGYGTLGSSMKSTVDSVLNSYLNDTNTASDLSALKSKLLDIKQPQVRNDYIQKYITDFKADQTKMDQLTAEVRTDLEQKLPVGETLDDAVLQKAVDTRIKTDAATAAQTEYDAWKAGTATTGNIFKDAETSLDSLLLQYTQDNDPADADVPQANVLSNLKLDEITKNADGTISYTENYMKLIKPSDAIIEYNGVEMNNSSNTFKVNGLTFNLKGVTDGSDTPIETDDQTIRLTVTNDTQAVYDTVKDFVKQYDELITEMNKGYYAVSAAGYDPLTDDQKANMTDSQIEQWETKIKDSLLRRDGNLSTLTSTMRSIQTDAVKIDGKSYSLSSFGIASANYTEKGLLHISGDKDDSLTSGLEDKLMKALNEDPDKVMTVMNKIASNLYKTLSDDMKSSTLRSALTLYNDKEMTSQIKDYKSDLSTLEDKLQDIENRYYKQFSAMETAMSKLNSQSSSLASMLGKS